LYKIGLGLAFVFLLSISGLSSTSVQEQRILGINVTTDKITYTPADEKVIISGCVRSLESSLEGRQVLIEIIDPDSESVHSSNTTINDTCNFAFPFNINENGLAHGNYVVQASYGNQTGVTAFRFSNETNSKADGECQDPYCIYYFRLYSNIYPIKYMLTDGRITTMFADIHAHALMVVTNSTTDGTLSMVLPRYFIDSKNDVNDGGSDRPYLVYIGNFTENFGMEESKSQELTIGEEDRIVVVNYPAGTKQIEIIGTYFVPEFSSLMVGIIMIASIAGVAVWSKCGTGSIRFRGK